MQMYLFIYLQFFQVIQIQTNARNKKQKKKKKKTKTKIKLPSDFRGKAAPLSSPVPSLSLSLYVIRNGHFVIVGSNICISSAAWRQYRIALPRPARRRLRPHPCRSY